MPDRHYLETHETRLKDGYRTPLGGVETKKNYVSVHVMPVYVHPEVLASLSDGLRKRMQGTSCFNSRKQDPDLFAELGGLIDGGVARFAESTGSRRALR